MSSPLASTSQTQVQDGYNDHLNPLHEKKFDLNAESNQKGEAVPSNPSLPGRNESVVNEDSYTHTHTHHQIKQKVWPFEVCFIAPVVNENGDMVELFDECVAESQTNKADTVVSLPPFNIAPTLKKELLLDTHFIIDKTNSGFERPVSRINDIVHIELYPISVRVRRIGYCRDVVIQCSLQHCIVDLCLCLTDLWSLPPSVVHLSLSRPSASFESTSVCVSELRYRDDEDVFMFAYTKPSQPNSDNFCSACFKRNGSLFTCKQCQQCRYCNIACQTAHWQFHRKDCTPNLQVSLITSRLCGLKNIGNSCYLNAAVVCLGQVQELTQVFLSDSYKQEVNESNPLAYNGVLVKAYARMIKQMWLGDTLIHDPSSFKQKFSSLAPQFQDRQQHDAQEFLAFLIDGLHEELCRIMHRPLTSSPVDSPSISSNTLANQYWNTYIARNDSIIADLFAGQYQSTIFASNTDTTCRSRVYDVFTHMSLPLSNLDLPIQVSFTRIQDAFPALRLLVQLRNGGNVADIKRRLCSFLPPERDVILSLNARILDDTFPLIELREDEIVRAHEIQRDDTSNILIKMRVNHMDDEFVCRVSSRERWTSLKLRVLESSPISATAAVMTVVVDGHTMSETLETIVGTPVEAMILLQLEGSLPACASELRQQSLPDRLFIDECMQDFSNIETLDDEISCGSCKKQHLVSKRLEMWRLPSILIVHLKRFDCIMQHPLFGVTPKKVSTFVQFCTHEETPLQIYELSTNDTVEYELIGVINHHGAAFFGHYTAMVRDFNKQWQHVDDDVVKSISSAEVCTKNAYILLYRRRASLQSISI